ncbi:MAG: hypothetical protein CR997_03465 [Acidobacteria bacterium]|nr:MAG: hypothetical protein CR997_03465 [Acidobacteriota bacterium]
MKTLFIIFLTCPLFAQELSLYGSYIPPYTHQTRAVTLYNQDDLRKDSAPSQKAEDTFSSVNTEIADDFIVPEGERWEIDSVWVLANYATRINGVMTPIADAEPKSMIISVYENNDNPDPDPDLPGALIDSRPLACIMQDEDGTGTLTASLLHSRDTSDTTYPYDCNEDESSIVLGPGHYWISMVLELDLMNSHPDYDFIQWFWIRCDESVAGNLNNSAVYKNPEDGFGSGCTTWAPITPCINNTGTSTEGDHMVFSIMGNRHRVTPGNTGPYCEGDTITLSANYVYETSKNRAVAYSWTGPGGFTSTEENPTIANAAMSDSGAYTVTVTNDPGGPEEWQISASTEVVVNTFPPQPEPASNSTDGTLNYVCPMGTLELYGLPDIQDALYSWTGPNGFTSSEQNPSIPNADNSHEGTYYLSITIHGCSSGPVPVVVAIGLQAGDDSITASSNSPVCMNGTLQLSATLVPGATYSWQGPSAQTSDLREPAYSNVDFDEEGSWTVTATVGNCSSRNSVLVDINPDTPVASNDGPVCEGSDLSLSATGPANATFNWVGPNGFNATGSSTILTAITPDQAGTYSVTATVDGCTSLPDTTEVEVLAKPATPNVSSNQPVCVGDTLELFCPKVTGATYSWTGPGSWSSSLQNPTRENVQDSGDYEGTYSLTITVNGCTSDAGTHEVTVGSSTGPATAPEAHSNSPVCLGGTLTLDSEDSAEGYQWIGPDGQSYSETWDIPTPIPAIDVTPVSRDDEGIWKLYIYNNGCASPATEITVVVNPAPPTITGDAELCEGNTLTLTATDVADASYEWKDPNNQVLSETGSVLTIQAVELLHDGIFTLTMTTPDMCTTEEVYHALSVKPRPDVSGVTSNSPVCHGDEIVFSAPETADAAYSWTGPNGFSSSLRSPSITEADNAHEGTYTCTITVDGCSDSSQTDVIVGIQSGSDAVTANINDPVCLDGNLSLDVTSVEGATYNWTGPKGQSYNTQNPTVSPVTRDEDGVWTVLVAKHGCTSTDQVTVKVSPDTPTAQNNSPVCPGADVQLSATGETGSIFHWQGPNEYSATGATVQLSSVEENDEGTYSVRAELDGCYSEWVETQVTVHDPDPTGDLHADQPCIGGTLTLTAEGSAVGTYSWSGPDDWSAMGKVVTRSPITLAQHGTYQLDFTSTDECTVEHKTLEVTYSLIHTPSQAIGLEDITMQAGINSLSCPAGQLDVDWYEVGNPDAIHSTESWVLDVSTITESLFFEVEVNDGTLASPETAAITLLYHPEGTDFDGNSINDIHDLWLGLNQWNDMNPPGANLPDLSMFDGNPGVDVRDYLFINVGSPGKMKKHDSSHK